MGRIKEKKNTHKIYLSKGYEGRVKKNKLEWDHIHTHTKIDTEKERKKNGSKSKK